jgi:hypothetical protein
LILFFQIYSKIKGSQPAAAPTGCVGIEKGDHSNAKRRPEGRRLTFNNN